MSNDKTSKDFELEDLEKPLTEQEMKETTGGGNNVPGLFFQPPQMPTKPPEIHVPVNPCPSPPTPSFAIHTQPTLQTTEPTVTPILPTPKSNGSGKIPDFVPKELRDKLGNP